MQKWNYAIVLGFAATQLFGQDATNHSDSLQNQHFNEIVVSASRISEKLLAAPVSISTLDALQIQQTAAPSFFDALGTMKGVQMLTPSLGFKVINTHGFSNGRRIGCGQNAGFQSQSPSWGGF